MSRCTARPTLTAEAVSGRRVSAVYRSLHRTVVSSVQVSSVQVAAPHRRQQDSAVGARSAGPPGAEGAAGRAQVFVRFKELADVKKGITDDDITALAADEFHQPLAVWDLVDLQVTLSPSASVQTQRHRGWRRQSLNPG